MNDLSIGPHIRGMLKKRNESEFREELLQKFIDRKELSQKELSYLDLTSSLTQKCIDHKFLQQMSKVVSP